MNNRYFDHIMHATTSARKLLNALKDAGGDIKNLTADDIVNTIVVGIVGLAVRKAGVIDDGARELCTYIFDTCNIKNREIPPEKFTEAAGVLAESFKGGARNDYQFFWNMIKEAMYCIESDVDEKYGVKLEASTISYHTSNAAKEVVGATGLEFSSDQLVF